MTGNEKFKLGQFKVSQTVGETKCDVLVDPLTQTDMADGWNMVLPRKNKSSTRHHFNIMLSQLPVHLWYRVEKDNDEYYYNISDNTADGYKPGYFAGFRVDGLYKDKRNYSFQVSLNKIATANNYKDAKSLPPFLGSFSNFKADDQFLNLSMAIHYKKLLAISDTSKYQFYFVLGPSLDTRISGLSADNLVNNNYARFLLRGDVGFEFENKNFYTLFLHYKQGLTSFTKSPIKTNVNSFELGMMIKASDLF